MSTAIVIPPSAHTHPWGIPDVLIKDPLGADSLPLTPWQSLKFHPIGLIHLRRHQGVFPYISSFFKTKQPSFAAADIAWFAAGLHKDGKHHRAQDSFHPEYLDLHNVCGMEKDTRPVQKALLESVLELIFDLATLLDRAGGGTTLVLHANGTTKPGSPYQPEYLKAEACFPPAFISQHPSSRPALLRIAQDFITHIGVPTADDWNRRARSHLHWGFSTDHVRPLPNQIMTDVPLPASGTSHYVFRGQPVPPQALLSPVPSSSSHKSSNYGFDDYNGQFLTELAYQEHIGTLSAELDDLRQERDDLRVQVRMLESMLEIDRGPAFQPTTPRTPTRKPLAQRTPGPGPESPYVALRSDRHRSPLVTSPSHSHTLEPTTPSISRLTHGTHVATPMSNAITPSRRRINTASTSSAIAGAAAVANTLSAATRTANPRSMVAHILNDHGVLHLKTEVSLILGIFSKASDAGRLVQELEKVGVPKAGIMAVRKAFAFDREEEDEL